MQILTTGKNLDIGDALRSHIEERLGREVSKYFEGAVSVQVVIEKQRSRFITDCVLHLSTGLVLSARGSAGEAYASFDSAAEHLEKRLRRYKRRLRDHHNNRHSPVAATFEPGFVIASEAEHEPEPEHDNPTIIAETSEKVETLSVGEAVMKLDISTTPFVLFRNAGHGGINIVYRREDGHIGWIDARPDQPRDNA
jgi:ribosomal subunit interface protein